MGHLHFVSVFLRLLRQAYNLSPNGILVMSATGLTPPPWVVSAEVVLHGSDNHTSSAEPISEDYQPLYSCYQVKSSCYQVKSNQVKSNVTLGTHRQEKAGFTCAMCPNPHRPTAERGPKYVDYNKREGTFVLRTYTERCRACNTEMKRWQRARALNDRVHNAHAFFEDSVLAFVTLTKPNVPDLPGRGSLQEEARLMKQQVANFRRGKRMGKIVLGGIDVVENTISHDGSWNIHHHGIWVMNGYYKQKDLDEDWGLGRVHIEKVRKPHATLRYLTSYVSKTPIPGVRCLETFKALRGSAYAVIEDYLHNQKECAGAEPASDEAGSTSHLNS